MYTEVLVEVGRGLALAHAVPVRYVDELVLVSEAGVGVVEALQLLHARQVLQVVVPPVVQLGERGARAPLLRRSQKTKHRRQIPSFHTRNFESLRSLPVKFN